MDAMSTAATANPLERLRAVREEEQRLGGEKLRLIGLARRQGASWAVIGKALGMSKQAAWEQYRAEITAMLDRMRDRADWTEDEAMEIARQELAAVRRDRRERTQHK
jgi:hypothetical protein